MSRFANSSMAAAEAESVASLVKGVVYVITSGFQLPEKTQYYVTWNSLFILLVFVLLVVLPTWSHNRTWGYTPTDVLGLILVIFDMLFWVRHTLHGENMPVLHG